MQGFAERKKEEKKLLETEEKKKQPMAPGAITMSEGPMLLPNSNEVERHGRVSFEASVKVELNAIKGKKKGKKGKKGKKRQKKIKLR